MVKYKYLKTAIGAVNAVQDILVKEKPVIGVKCLGVNLGQKDGRLCLVAVSTWDGNVYVFDVKVSPAIMYEGGLLRLLQSAELLKVFHNCGPDSAALHIQFGVRLKNFFDTQIAYSIIMEREGLSPRRVPIHTLCGAFNQPCFNPSLEFKQLLQEDMNVWARRPCTKEALTMAASYVKPLVPEIFTATDSALPPSTDDWFSHLCEENRLSKIATGKRSGKKSTTQCPFNRLPTKSIHLVPLTDTMHFCL